MNEVKVTHAPLAASAVLDEGIWSAWLARGRKGELRLRHRMNIALAFSPFLLVIAWFWFRR